MVEEIPEFLLQQFKYDDEDKKYGGEAWVVKGTHPFLAGEVAIKTWMKAENDNEIKLLTERINHKNIIQLLGILINRRSECIGYIMPYMDRGSLDDVIHNTDENHDDIYTSEQVTSWITQICEGLSYLHSNNIIHRDIKPSNILLGESLNDLKLSDFGMARSLDDIRSLTKEIGTSVYMPPEMLSSEDYDISVDIYSLSITIWEILHRRTSNPSVFQLVKKIDDGERPELGSDLSKEVADLLKRCWHLDAFQRPTSYDVLQFSKNTGFQISGGNGGSRLLDSVLVLQSDEETRENWKKINIKLTFQLHFHGAQFLKNNIYIFGGLNAKKVTLNYTCKLSKKLEWERMADMNDKRTYISNGSVILNDRIWVLGGGNGKEVLKSVEMYDPSINKWKYMKQMNECRGDAAAAVVSGKIFCCGGWSGKNLLDSTECYDPSSDVWTFISLMPLPLSGLGAVAMNGNLIVIGGGNFTGESRSVWGLDTSNKKAEWIGKSSMPLERRSFSIAKIDDKIFVCGGSSNGWVISDVETFDGEIWKKGPNLINARNYAASTVIPINFGKYLEYGITRFGRTKTKSKKTYLRGENKTLTVNDINIEKETILLLGGWDRGKRLDSLLILQNNGENWKELSIKLPYPIQRHGAQFLDNFLYIFGGQSEQEILNSTYKVSSRLKWEHMADMNEKRSYISNTSVILNDRIWVLGGFNGKEMLKSVEMYDPSTNEWKYMKEMNECRGGAAVAVVSGKIFCCGGSTGKILLNSIECYDPSLDVWTFISNMSLSLHGLGAVAMGGNLIVIGGYTDTEESKNVWILDTLNKNAEWIEKPSISIGRSRFIIAKIDDKIFVCGGFSEEDTIADVEIFDGEVWKNGPKLQTPRMNAAAIVIPTNFAEYLK